METIKTQARVGKDGLLRLEVPLDLRDVDLEVLLVVHPLTTGQGSRDEWLAFLEQTAGSLADGPLERPPQGEYEVREPLE